MISYQHLLKKRNLLLFLTVVYSVVEVASKQNKEAQKYRTYKGNDDDTDFCVKAILSTVHHCFCCDQWIDRMISWARSGQNYLL